ncbi:FAD/NAD(P)-binding protein [Streptosporangium sp. OZ121]|uniref:FAD/NAD(P)-binding protein n=1 Tax=Streptosporangium sp. OZ121 TaxID=3444183 RepID=UPI003F79A566
MSAAIAVVGAGPTGTCLVERICANAADLLGWPSLDVHVIDPHPPGGGRVWRHDQPDLLWMNSTAADVTLFTDESVRCEGPIRPGPTLAEWLGCDPGGFASRPAQNGYLSHVFRQAVATAPRGVRVHVHAARAVDLAEVTASRFAVNGRDALRFGTRDRRRLRGRFVGLVFQDALTSFDPLRTVGDEIAEVLATHDVVPRAARREGRGGGARG